LFSRVFKVFFLFFVYFFVNKSLTCRSADRSVYKLLQLNLLYASVITHKVKHELQFLADRT